MAPVNNPNNSRQPIIGGAASSSTSAPDDNEDDTSNESVENIKNYLNCRSFYLCIGCRTHLADHDELASRSFHGSHGRANLFNSVINVVCGRSVQRDLITGTHDVSDVYCKKCGRILGWRYDKAYPKDQKYKEGKYVIELAHVIRQNRHLDMDNSDVFFGTRPSSIATSSSSGSPGTIFTGSSYESSSSHSNSLPSQTENNNNTDANNSYSCSYKSDYSDSMSTHHERLNSISSKPIQLRRGSMISEARKGCDSLASSPYDEDLLFAFYDDWCASKPSQPNNISSTHFNKIRRSLYSESTRYDWKSQDNNSTTTTRR